MAYVPAHYQLAYTGGVFSEPRVFEWPIPPRQPARYAAASVHLTSGGIAMGAFLSPPITSPHRPVIKAN